MTNGGILLELARVTMHYNGYIVLEKLSSYHQRFCIIEIVIPSLYVLISYIHILFIGIEYRKMRWKTKLRHVQYV